MTTYEDNLESTEAIPFIELFEFRRGFEMGRYTNHKESILFDGNTYHSVSISRGEFKHDSNLSNVSVDVAVGIIDTFATYLANQPSIRTTLKIYRAVSDDLTEYVILINGDVTGVSFTDQNVCTLKVEEQAGILDRDVKMITHSAVCDHALFYGGCRLDVLTHRIVTSDIIVVGKIIYGDAFSAFADGYFTGGEAHTSLDARMITNHVGNALHLHVAFDSAVATGTEIEVYPGCDRLIATCRVKYSNAHNFLGMPFIPHKNPAIWGI